MNRDELIKVLRKALYEEGWIEPYGPARSSDYITPGSEGARRAVEFTALAEADLKTERSNRNSLLRVLTEIEPLIRASEQERNAASLDQMDMHLKEERERAKDMVKALTVELLNVRTKTLSTLYGQVEAMDGVKGSRGHPLLYRKDVLALIDGSGE